MTDDLKSEIISWRFLDSWTGKLEWKKERHLTVNVFTDSSLFKWGGYLTIEGKEQKFGDSWPREMTFLPIMVLEAISLLNVLNSSEDAGWTHTWIIKH